MTPIPSNLIFFVLCIQTIDLSPSTPTEELLEMGPSLGPAVMIVLEVLAPLIVVAPPQDAGWPRRPRAGASCPKYCM